MLRGWSWGSGALFPSPFSCREAPDTSLNQTPAWLSEGDFVLPVLAVSPAGLCWWDTPSLGSQNNEGKPSFVQWEMGNDRGTCWVAASLHASWAEFRGDDVFVSGRFIQTSYRPWGPPWLPQAASVPACPTWLGSKWLQRGSWATAKVFVVLFFPFSRRGWSSCADGRQLPEKCIILHHLAPLLPARNRWFVTQQFLIRDETCVRTAKATLKMFSWSHLGGFGGIHASLRPPRPDVEMKATTSATVECFTWRTCPWSSILCLGNHLTSLELRLEHKSSSNKNWP